MVRRPATLWLSPCTDSSAEPGAWRSAPKRPQRHTPRRQHRARSGKPSAEAASCSPRLFRSLFLGLPEGNRAALTALDDAEERFPPRLGRQALTLEPRTPAWWAGGRTGEPGPGRTQQGTKLPSFSSGRLHKGLSEEQD
ncbi:uncharacterized protein LOC143267321 [Peromyscus maniculatus bairdii]|uniref:uncharacterized protein LOC143267321 n=1 Tax=Peromyscus maniculatus bairdii TaxID=230844 RepID=UPI003FCF7AEC